MGEQKNPQTLMEQNVDTLPSMGEIAEHFEFIDYPQVAEFDDYPCVAVSRFEAGQSPPHNHKGEWAKVVRAPHTDGFSIEYVRDGIEGTTVTSSALQPQEGPHGVERVTVFDIATAVQHYLGTAE